MSIGNLFMQTTVHNGNILIMAGAVLSLISMVIAILPVGEADAKQCNNSNKNNNNNDNNDQNNNSNDDGSSCTNQQQSNNRHDPIVINRSPFIYYLCHFLRNRTTSCITGDLRSSII